jgi:hypothetical protein
MSDFLSNLAATALHVTPIAQPRTPALFEPPAVDAAAPPIENVEALATPSTFTARAETRVEQRATREQLNTSLRSQSNHVIDSISRVEEKAHRSEWQPATIATPIVTPSVPRPAPVPLPKIEPAGREEQSGRAGAAHSVVEETSAPVSTSPLTPRTSPVEIIHPRIERQARDVDGERDTNEPRIHISIGRIEVRASMASAPTRAAKREATILGLDDFLRQRR